MRSISFVALLLCSALAAAERLIDFPRAQVVMETLVAEHKIDRTLLEIWMSEATYRPAAVSNLAAPAERTQTYAQYRPTFLSPRTIVQGRRFIQEHQLLLGKAEVIYGVPVAIIAAIIGIESRYGRSVGRYRAFESLGSLAVNEGRRADYFQREWIRFVVLTHELGIDPLSIKSSYAGASGYPQFMPTSYQAYAVDHDEDGDIDIWNDPHDAIGSVANYLRQNGWRAGQKIVSSVSVANPTKIKINSFARDRRLADVLAAGWQIDELLQTTDHVFPIRLEMDSGPQYWLGYRNFWSISRYNRSIPYAMAVVQLAQALEG